VTAEPGARNTSNSEGRHWRTVRSGCGEQDAQGSRESTPREQASQAGQAESTQDQTGSTGPGGASSGLKHASPSRQSGNGARQRNHRKSYTSATRDLRTKDQLQR
jgi:hypothetical protein